METKYSNCQSNNNCTRAKDKDVDISTKNQAEFENIQKSFSEYILKKDFNKIENLLLDTGEYDIQNEKFATISVNKTNFLKWFIPLINEVKIESIETDHCLYCKIGNPVLIINKGSFPRKIKSLAEWVYTGLMLEFEVNKISGITFCYTFLDRENIDGFRNNNRKIRELENQGVSKKEAFFQVLGFDYDKNQF